MKHLVKFESIHREYTKNDYYEFAPDNGSEDHEFEKWTKEEVDFICSELKLPEHITYYPYGGAKTKKSLIWTATCEISLQFRKYHVKILKYKDEWYKVYLYPEYGTMVHQATRNYVYMCDQVTGLLKLLKEFIK